MDNFESKVRVTLPQYAIEVLDTDIYDFDTTKNKLCNEIFLALHHIRELDNSLNKNSETDVLQFTLNKTNLDFFIDGFPRQEITNKAEYFRRIFITYCNQPRYKRELSLNEPNVTKIKKAISQKRKLLIRYNKEFRYIEPYAILRSDNETRNYIFCYCHKHQDYINYRLTKTDAVSVTRECFEYYDQDFVAGVKKKFDPFLSFGKVVVARLSENGRNIYEHNITHRPYILEQKGNVYKFECSELRAKIYFPQFLGEVEILEPLELREWFKAGSTKMATVYSE